MTRHTATLSALTVVTAAVILGTATPVSGARERIPFEEANVFAELNDTDGDLGFHALIDGDAFDQLTIRAPNRRQILLLRPQRGLARQGLNELFFESAEPLFDDLSPEEFFERFPEGGYKIEGRALSKDRLESIAELTHLIPAPPGNISVSGTSVDPDEVDCDEGPIPSVSGDIAISWDPVLLSHPRIGRANEPIDVVKYELVVELEELEVVYSVDLPPDVTTMTVPPEFLDLGEEFKFEILAREASGNQTAVESCFAIE